MGKLLLRKTAGSKVQYEFPVKGVEYLVKNFTESAIYAGIGDLDSSDDCARIPAETAQIIRPTMRIKRAGSAIVTVFAESTSEEVEIQCLRW